jgi:hypothetical protein
MSVSKKEQKNSLKAENISLKVENASLKEQYEGLIKKREYFDSIIVNYNMALRMYSAAKKKEEKGHDGRIERGQLNNLTKLNNMLINAMPYPERVQLKDIKMSPRIHYLQESIKRIDGQISVLKERIEEKERSIVENDVSIKKLGSIFGSIKRSVMGSKKGGRKSKMRSRKNKRKTRRKGGVLKPSVSTAVLDMKHKRNKSIKNDNKTIKDSKKNGGSGFSFKLTKKMASKLKNKKMYGGEDENLFISDKLNIDPNKKYKTVGIAHHTELAGINVLRDMGNDIFNMFGQKGFDTGLYNRARNDGIRVLINKLKSNQVLKSPKFDIELKEQQGIQVHITALIMEEVSEKEEKD